jgi:hypothetical protein
VKSLTTHFSQRLLYKQPFTLALRAMPNKPTPCCRVLSKKLPVTQMVTIFPELYRHRRFTVVLTGTRHCAVYRGRLITSTPSRLTFRTIFKIKSIPQPTPTSPYFILSVIFLVERLNKFSIFLFVLHNLPVRSSKYRNTFDNSLSCKFQNRVTSR